MALFKINPSIKSASRLGFASLTLTTGSVECNKFSWAFEAEDSGITSSVVGAILALVNSGTLTSTSLRSSAIASLNKTA